MYKILIFSKYISHTKEIKVNNLTQYYLQNLIFPLEVFKFDPREQKLFKKARTCQRFHQKCIFVLHIILSELDNIQKLV